MTKASQAKKEKKAIRARSALLNSALAAILLNNITYQTSLQLNQSLFICAIFLLCLLSVACKPDNKISNPLILLSFAAISYTSFSIITNTTADSYTNRALFNLITLSSYLLIFFSLSEQSISNLFLKLFFPIYIAGAIYITLSGNRDLFNPNWIAMTLFYLLSLTNHRKSITLLALCCFITFIAYESRGASLSMLTVLLALALINLIKKFRKTLFILYSAGTIGMFFLVHFLFINRDSIFITMSDIAGDGRGLGGREGALIEGFSRLKESNYLGEGIGASTSFSVTDKIGIQKDVHVHFGLLDIALKFGILGVIISYYLAFVLINKSLAAQLPWVLGGLLSILYYNGLATSHLGLNLLLYLLLGHSYHQARLLQRQHNQPRIIVHENQ